MLECNIWPNRPELAAIACGQETQAGD